MNVDIFYNAQNHQLEGRFVGVGIGILKRFKNQKALKALSVAGLRGLFRYNRKMQ